MQRDFLEPGGFGELLGNDVAPARAGRRADSQPCSRPRGRPGMLVVHTREGHRARPQPTARRPSSPAAGSSSAIGSDGPKGRILVRGEEGHDIVDERRARARARSCSTSPARARSTRPTSSCILRNHGITSLIVSGVTTEVCVHTTVREANDRGFECLVLSDCVGSYFPEFHEVGLRMIAAQGGIFGWVAPSADAARRPAPPPASATHELTGMTP